MYSQEREIKIERLAYGGEGIGYADGKVCFVEGGLPGEKVRAAMGQDKKKFIRARAIEILTPSPHRVAPPCIYVESCGGCQYQHLDYAEELRWKELQVREYLERNLKIPGNRIKAIIPSPSPYGYRVSVTLHKARNGGGFVGRDNLSIIPVKECLLARPELKAAFQNPAFPEKTDSISFKVSKDGKVISNTGEQLFEIRTGEQSILTHSKSFFQNNPEVTAVAGEKLQSWVRAARPDIFMDLYSGVGTFTLLAAMEVPSLLCAEENPYGVQALRENLKARNREAVVLEGAVEKMFEKWARANPSKNAFVFLDPPRKGMHGKFTRFLSAEENFKTLAYLSCHLGTLTRDLSALMAGGWQIEEVLPLDMFARTKHIEVLTLLKRGVTNPARTGDSGKE